MTANCKRWVWPYSWPRYRYGWDDLDYYAEAAWELMSTGGVSVQGLGNHI